MSIGWHRPEIRNRISRLYTFSLESLDAIFYWRSGINRNVMRSFLPIGLLDLNALHILEVASRHILVDIAPDCKVNEGDDVCVCVYV